jgi:hypothetical protein
MSRRPRGPLPSWHPTTARQQAILADLQQRYQQHADADTLPRSGRGLFYDLRPHGLGHRVTYLKPRKGQKLGPMEASPETVQEVLVLARRAGIIAEHWVADARAPEPLTVPSYVNAEEFAAETVELAKSFQLDLQRGQERYIEVLCEAEDLAPRLARVAEPYGAAVYSSGGFAGLKGKRTMAARAANREVPTIVLQVGDLDPHGEHIYTSHAEDAAAWVPPGTPGGLVFQRIAVTRVQAEAYDLLDEDGHAEADGIPVPAMDALLTGWLDRLLDPDIRDAVLEDQEEERARLGDVIRQALR